MATKQLPRLSRGRRVAVIVFLLAVVPTVVFGIRSYGSLRLLRSAYEIGASATSSIRPWMTLHYVATSYRVPEATLITGLQLPPQTDSNTSLKALADQAGVSPLVYAQRVQRAVATSAAPTNPSQSSDNSSWLSSIGDQTLTALLIYGYPALGLLLLLSAIGLPLPAGAATTIAGSLASQGRIDWFWAATIAATASVLGDVIGFGLGRLADQGFLERHGRLFGLTAARRARAALLFDRWGLLTVFITRTFMSSFSFIASVFAGLSRCILPKFLAIALIGRVVWTAGYFGLGYAIGADWEAATSFLTNLSVLLLLLLVLVVSGSVASGRFSAPGRP